MVAIVHHGRKEKGRLQKAIHEQKKTIEDLENDIKVSKEGYSSAKGAQTLAHRQDMESVINQNMGLLQRHQEMLQSVPEVLKECSRKNNASMKRVKDMEDQTRNQIRGMDKSHTEELNLMKKQYESWRQQNEQAKVELEHKCRKLEQSIKSDAGRSQALVNELYQVSQALLNVVEMLEGKGVSSTGQRTGLKAVLPSQEALQSGSSVTDLQRIVKTARVFLTGRSASASRQRPCSAPAARSSQSQHPPEARMANSSASLKNSQPKREAVYGTGQELARIREELSQQRKANSDLHVALLAKDRIITSLQASGREYTRGVENKSGGQARGRPQSAHVRSSARGSMTAR